MSAKNTEIVHIEVIHLHINFTKKLSLNMVRQTFQAVSGLEELNVIMGLIVFNMASGGKQLRARDIQSLVYYL